MMNAILLLTLALLVGGGNNPVPIQGSGHVTHTHAGMTSIDGVIVPTASLDTIPGWLNRMPERYADTDAYRTKWTDGDDEHEVVTVPEPGEDDDATAARHVRRIKALKRALAAS